MDNSVSQLILASFLSLFFLGSQPAIGQSEDTQQKRNRKRFHSTNAADHQFTNTCFLSNDVKDQNKPTKRQFQSLHEDLQGFADAHVVLCPAESSACSMLLYTTLRGSLLLCLISPTARDDSFSLTPLGAKQTKSYSLKVLNYYPESVKEAIYLYFTQTLGETL